METGRNGPGSTAFSSAFGWHFFEVLNLFAEQVGPGKKVTSDEFLAVFAKSIGGGAFKKVEDELVRRISVFLEVLESDGLITGLVRIAEGGVDARVIEFEMSERLCKRRLVFRHPVREPGSTVNPQALELVGPIMAQGGEPITDIKAFVESWLGSMSNGTRANHQSAMASLGFLEAFGPPVRGIPRTHQTPISWSLRPMRSVQRDEGDDGRVIESDFVRFAFLSFRAVQCYHVLRFVMPAINVFAKAADLNRAWRAVTGLKKIDTRTKVVLVENGLLQMQKFGTEWRYKVSPQGTAQLITIMPREQDVLDLKEIERICKASLEAGDGDDDDDGAGNGGSGDGDGEGDVNDGKLPVITDELILKNRAYTLMQLFAHLQHGDEPVTTARATEAHRVVTGNVKIHPFPIRDLRAYGILERMPGSAPYSYRLKVDVAGSTGIRYKSETGRKALFTLEQIKAKLGQEADAGGDKPKATPASAPIVLEGMPDIGAALDGAIRPLFDWIGEHLIGMTDPNEVLAVMAAVDDARERMAGSLTKFSAGLQEILEKRNELAELQRQIAAKREALVKGE
jgi:hypothetical protein